VLGADIGTSGLKLVALGEDGSVVAEAEAGYEPDRPQPGWAQSDVGSWVRALDTALQHLAGELRHARVRGLGLSGQMHGAVLVDAGGRALTPALLWQDERAGEELQRWRDLPAADRAALANPLDAGMTGPLAA
jgi:xylulokinase